MDREAFIAELRIIIGDYLKGEGLDLIELIYRYEGRDLFLRVLTDKPEGGITLGECVLLNKELSRILDEKDIMQEGYLLEVSSPGLDRPLKTKSDFMRCVNRRARFFLNQPVNGKIEIEGLISNAGDNSVYINIGQDTIEIPLNSINKAKQIVE